MLIEIFRLGLFIYGIYLISQGKMALGVLLVIYNYYAQIIDNFTDFATVNVNFRNLKVSEERINKILIYSKHSASGEQFSSKHNGNITFNNILYGYKDHPTLNRINFYARAGELTCIVGDANSGKSGIVDLLLKFNRQHEGDVLIDYTDINDFKDEEYHSLVAYTSNETTFFNMSIRENLSIIDNDFDRIVEVCKKLGIHEYIIKLKDGYDSIMVSNGANFDLNVKQLLGIARVLIKDSKIMLFNEIFSTLNSHDKQVVINIIENIKRDHTILVFTKDPSILEKSDKVIFLSNNRVIDIDSHDNLIKTSEQYKSTILM
jgi:ATP-binding cassette subfamily B protein